MSARENQYNEPTTKEIALEHIRITSLLDKYLPDIPFVPNVGRNELAWGIGENRIRRLLYERNRDIRGRTHRTRPFHHLYCTGEQRLLQNDDLIYDDRAGLWGADICAYQDTIIALLPLSDPLDLNRRSRIRSAIKSTIEAFTVTFPAGQPAEFQTYKHRVCAMAGSPSSRFQLDVNEADSSFGYSEMCRELSALIVSGSERMFGRTNEVTNFDNQLDPVYSPPPAHVEKSFVWRHLDPHLSPFIDLYYVSTRRVPVIMVGAGDSARGRPCEELDRMTITAPRGWEMADRSHYSKRICYYTTYGRGYIDRGPSGALFCTYPRRDSTDSGVAECALRRFGTPTHPTSNSDHFHIQSSRIVLDLLEKSKDQILRDVISNHSDWEAAAMKLAHSQSQQETEEADRPSGLHAIAHKGMRELKEQKAIWTHILVDQVKGAVKSVQNEVETARSSLKDMRDRLLGAKPGG